MKLFIVLILAVILVGPTLAKNFSKQQAPAKRRGIFYRLGRRYGVTRMLIGVVVLFVVVPTALWGLLVR